MTQYSKQLAAQLPGIVAHLRGGGLLVMPTETVYGLAANAADEQAVARIFAAKQRPTFDPLIVHVADPEMAWRYAQVNAQARRLAEALWPGPLTLVLPRRRGMVADLVTSGLDTVALRCPDHPQALTILRESGLALAAPSANRFGRTSPTCAAHVGDEFAAHGALVVDGGPCRIGLESTVLSCVEEPLILRPGGVTPEQLAEVLGFTPAIAGPAVHAQHLPAPAPGMLASHYAPHKPLVLRAPEQPWPRGNEWGLCVFAHAQSVPTGPVVEYLSPGGDLGEAASRLFACLRRLDASSAKRLCAELLPNEGLGVAINDRLRRAAGVGE